MHQKLTFRGIAMTVSVLGEALPCFEVSPTDPFVFIPGRGELIPAVEAAMVGAADHEERAFTIPPGTYGAYDPLAHASFPRAAFGGVKTLVAGLRVEATRVDGAIQIMTVLHVGPDFVRMDLNHPLAGKAAHVRARFVPVRQPSPTAFFHDLPRGEHLH